VVALQWLVDPDLGAGRLVLQAQSLQALGENLHRGVPKPE